MEVKIAVIKEWIEGFNPSNEFEKRFKSQVKEVLKEVSHDFMVGPAIPMNLDPTKTWEENIKAHEVAIGGRIMSVNEYLLIWAQLVAEGHDVIPFYYGKEELTAPEELTVQEELTALKLIATPPKEPQPKDFWMNLDRSAPVSWIKLEN